MTNWCQATTKPKPRLLKRRKRVKRTNTNVSNWKTSDSQIRIKTLKKLRNQNQNIIKTFKTQKSIPTHKQFRNLKTKPENRNIVTYTTKQNNNLKFVYAYRVRGVKRTVIKKEFLWHIFEKSFFIQIQYLNRILNFKKNFQYFNFYFCYKII